MTLDQSKFDNQSGENPMDFTEWTKDIRLAQPALRLFSECLSELPEEQRLLAAENVRQGILDGAVHAIPSGTKAVRIRMLTTRGRIESRPVMDYFITVDERFQQWLAQQARDCVYHLIRLTGKANIGSQDVSAGHVDVSQAQEAYRAFLQESLQPKSQPNRRKLKPKTRRRNLAKREALADEAHRES